MEQKRYKFKKYDNGLGYAVFDTFLGRIYRSFEQKANAVDLVNYLNKQIKKNEKLQNK